ncbi:MAG TPA: hypothetical protein PLA68_18355 [Panacibacter sp.]|nr:hypothetical protein [Panacibacter sp.]
MINSLFGMYQLYFISILYYLLPFFLTAGGDDTINKKNAHNTPPPSTVCNDDLCRNVVGVINPKTSYNENYVFDPSIYHYRLDTLAQVKFWRTIMNLHEDTAIISLASSREMIQKISMKDWNAKTDSAKKYYKDSVRLCRNLDTSSKIYITAGKKFFYDFDRTSQNFQKGIHCFIDNNVDPWYAQAILLIESPNDLQKSQADAYVSLQLMKDVARRNGLKVNKHVD